MPAAAASSLLAALLDEGCRPVEAARTRVSVHYETERDDVPVLCVGVPSAVRLPNMLVSPVLPHGGRESHAQHRHVGAPGLVVHGHPGPRGLDRAAALVEQGVQQARGGSSGHEPTLGPHRVWKPCA